MVDSSHNTPSVAVALSVIYHHWMHRSPNCLWPQPSLEYAIHYRNPRMPYPFHVSSTPLGIDAIDLWKESHRLQERNTCVDDSNRTAFDPRSHPSIWMMTHSPYTNWNVHNPISAYIRWYPFSRWIVDCTAVRDKRQNGFPLERIPNSIHRRQYICWQSQPATFRRHHLQLCHRTRCVWVVWPRQTLRRIHSNWGSHPDFSFDVKTLSFRLALRIRKFEWKQIEIANYRIEWERNLLFLQILRK